MIPLKMMARQKTFIFCSPPSSFAKCQSASLTTIVTFTTTNSASLAALALKREWKPMFPPRLDSCCNLRLMKRFRESPQTYFDVKFSSYVYQVAAADFLQRSVPTCMSNKKTTRAVILVSFREPITRTLSYIHQMCNKNFETCTLEIKKACHTSSYDEDVEFWDNFMQSANGQYQELYDLQESLMRMY